MTPFGWPSASLGMLAAQVCARDIAEDATTDKWKVFHDLSVARPMAAIWRWCEGIEMHTPRARSAYGKRAQSSRRRCGDRSNIRFTA